MPELIIDCQILQTPAYDRGMGKYTLSLLKALAKENKRRKRFDKITLLLNKNLTSTKQRRAILEESLPGAQQVLLDLSIDISHDVHKKLNQSREKITEYITNHYKRDQDLEFLVTAPFFVGFASVFPDLANVKKMSIVYDLTPQKIWHLQKIFPDDLYFGHYELLLDADHLFTISQAVKQDLINLGLPPKKIACIDGGPFMAQTKAKVEKTKLQSPYVLMPTAPIIHKNNDRAVRAFAHFNEKNNNRYHLYITSSFDEETKVKLKKICPQLSFTGNISDEELASAYSGANAVLFPSLAEGLGMPVLEAVVYDTPVACSRIPVLEEISDAAFYFFNPNSTKDIEQAIASATSKENWPPRKRAYRQVENKYSWRASAIKLLDTSVKLAKSPIKKPQLTIIAPNPQAASPAGYLAEQSYAQLSKMYQVDFQFKRTASLKRPSYVMHIGHATKDVNGTVGTLVLRDGNIAKRLLQKKRQVEITFKGTSGLRKKKARLASRQINLDSALHIVGWDFYASGERRITPGLFLQTLIQKGR